MSRYNKQAILMKDLVDSVREQHEMTKFIFYTKDNSEGAQILIEDTAQKGFFKSRYLNDDALIIRNEIFNAK